MSGKSPTKLEVTSRHDHSCLLGRKASNQTNKSLSLRYEINRVEPGYYNLAYVMIMLFINIKLAMIDNYLSEGFPGQLHEELCKCIGMIFA